MKRFNKNIISLNIIFIVILSFGISFSAENNNEGWIFVGKNQNYETINQVIKENMNQSLKIKLVDELHKEENIHINQKVIIEGLSEKKTKIQGKGQKNSKGTRIFKVLPDGNLTLNDLIIEKGYVNEHPRAGAGIYNMGKLIIKNCTIQKNIATYGVGIYSENHLEIYSSIIQSNTSIKRPEAEEKTGLGCGGSGGGIKIQRGSFIIENVLISNNYAVRTGGGIKVSCLSKGMINNAIIINNKAEDFGGGLSINGEASLGNTIVYNNKAFNGGGIHLTGTLKIGKSILLNNDKRDLELMLTNQNFKPILIRTKYNLIIDSIPSKYNYMDF